MRTVLITGASKGIGKTAANDFLQAGYNVVANYCTSEICECDFIHGKGKVLCVQADVSNYAQVKKMVDSAISLFNRIDVVINNAGVAYEGLLADMTEQDWDRIIDTNLKGVFNVCRCTIPAMVHNKSGRIINISSMWGITGASCEVAYSASKAGVIGFTKALAKELAPSGILVNCIAPGIIHTGMNAGHSVQELEQDIPLGRIGCTKDITSMMLFLANEDTSFVTGQVFNINGGTVI